MDPISIGLVGFGFYKLIQFITKEDEPSEPDEQSPISNGAPELPHQAERVCQSIREKEIPYNQ